MLAGIEALVALQKLGTVSEAAIRLRLTQSAVSKRLQALQHAVGFKLVEPDGRKIRLTSEAIGFLEQAAPLVAELRGLTKPVQSGSVTHFSLALADSIASSWGPRVVRVALQGLRGISVDLHAHRSVLLIEYVRLGRYHIGLCTDPKKAKDLIHCPVVDEPLALINCGLGRKPADDRPLISIEASSATWTAVVSSIRQRYPQLLKRQLITVESFGATLQMVKAGFGDGLVPLGLLIEMGLDRRCYRELPGIKRSISLLTRKTIHQLTSFQVLRDELVNATANYFTRRAT